MAAEEVHECCMLLWQSFTSNLWSCGWSSATYDAWWQTQSEAAAYGHYRACVQLIGSTETEKRWLLKNPGHIQNLDLLFAVFPDARVIQTHRDPAKAVPSLVSLLMQLHPLMEDGRADQRGEIMLRREVEKWAEATRRADIVPRSPSWPNAGRRAWRFPSRADARDRAYLRVHRHGYSGRHARRDGAANRREARTPARRPTVMPSPIMA